MVSAFNHKKAISKHRTSTESKANNGSSSIQPIPTKKSPSKTRQVVNTCALPTAESLLAKNISGVSIFRQIHPMRSGFNSTQGNFYVTCKAPPREDPKFSRRVSECWMIYGIIYLTEFLLLLLLLLVCYSGIANLPSII